MTNTNNYPTTEIESLVKGLQDTERQSRIKAASQLGRLGVRLRDNNPIRGTVFVAATARMAPNLINQMVEAVSQKDISANILQEIIFAVGEWADESAIPALAEIARHDKNVTSRVDATTALAKIGGREAVDVLRHIVRDDPHENVRANAVKGLGNLASASIITGSVTPANRDSEQTRTIQLLEEVRNADTSQYVRRLANGTLAALAA